MRPSDVCALLDRLRSVVRVKKPLSCCPMPPSVSSYSIPGDARAPTSVDRPDMHSRLVHAGTTAMDSCLRRSICKLEHPGPRVPNLDRATIDVHVAQHAQYACRYSVEHYRRAKTSSDAVLGLLRRHLSRWWEVMTLPYKDDFWRSNFSGCHVEFDRRSSYVLHPVVQSAPTPAVISYFAAEPAPHHAPTTLAIGAGAVRAARSRRILGRLAQSCWR